MFTHRKKPAELPTYIFEKLFDPFVASIFICGHNVGDKQRPLA